MRLWQLGSFAVGLLALPVIAAAGPASPLLCAVTDVYDCSGKECVEVESETVGVPDLVRLDRDAKTLVALDREFERKTSALEAVTTADGKTTAQAREDDRTLALVVDDASGDAMLVITDYRVVLIAYGECAAP